MAVVKKPPTPRAEVDAVPPERKKVRKKEAPARTSSIDPFVFLALTGMGGKKICVPIVVRTRQKKFSRKRERWGRGERQKKGKI